MSMTAKKRLVEKDVIITEDLSDLDDQGMQSIFLAERESRMSANS